MPCSSLTDSSYPQGTVAEQRPQLSDQMQNSSGSFELVLSAALLGVVGYFIDGWVGTRPVFMVSFIVLGFVGAVVSVYYRYKHEISLINEETAALRNAADQTLDQAILPKQARS